MSTLVLVDGGRHRQVRMNRLVSDSIQWLPRGDENLAMSGPNDSAALVWLAEDRQARGEYSGDKDGRRHPDYDNDAVGTLPTHSGDHREYTEQAREILDGISRRLTERYGSLENTPPDVLQAAVTGAQRAMLGRMRVGAEEGDRFADRGWGPQANEWGRSGLGGRDTPGTSDDGTLVSAGDSDLDLDDGRVDHSDSGSVARDLDAAPRDTVEVNGPDGAISLAMGDAALLADAGDDVHISESTLDEVPVRARQESVAEIISEAPSHATGRGEGAEHAQGTDHVVADSSSDSGSPDVGDIGNTAMVQRADRARVGAGDGLATG